MRSVMFHKFEMNFEDDSRSSDEELAFICALAYAVDEISTFKRLMVQAFRSEPHDAELRELFVAQLYTLSRTLSAKCLEATKLVSAYFSKCKHMQLESGLLDLLARHERRLVELKSNVYFELVRTVRDKATSHYDLDYTRKNIKSFRRRVKYTAYLHETEGSTFFPFGEKIAFQEVIERFFRKRMNSELTEAGINEWHDYELDLASFFVELLAGYLLWLKDNRYPEWEIKEWIAEVEPSLVGEVGTTALPLILERQGKG